MSAQQSADLDELLTSPEFYRDPYPAYHTLRTEDPVHWSEAWGGWVMTRYDDIEAVLRDHRRFTKAGHVTRVLDELPPSTLAQIGPLRENFSVGMPQTDPPEHTRVRALVSKAFTPAVIEGMGARIQAIVDELLEAVAPKGEMDLIADFAFPLPAIVVAEMIGCPLEDRDRFKKWSDDIVSFHGSGRADTARVLRSNQAFVETREWLRKLFDERRTRPGDDLLSRLVAVEQEGEMLSETELVATCITLLTAGHETTTGLIANGMLALLHHPEQRKLLEENPDLIESAVDEFLRYDPPFQRTWRLTTEDVEMRGKRMKKGQVVSQMLGAASRDPERFPDPDRLDITRQDTTHLAFGFGVHYCLGAVLAHREAELAVPTLLRRLPGLRLAVHEPEWQQNITFHAPKSLPLRFDQVVP